MAKRIMRELRIHEISGVDRPAQKGALAVIMKRDTSDAADLYIAKAAGMADLPGTVEEYLKRTFTADQRKTDADSGAALPDGSFPIKTRGDLENAIRALGRAKDAAKAKAHIIARARSLDATSLLPTDWKVGKTLGGDLILEITKLAPRALPDLLENVVKAEEIQAEIEKLDDKKVRKAKLAELDMAKSSIVASAWSIVDSASPEDAASLLQKSFAEYKDHVEKLLTPVSGANQGDEIMLKAIAKSLGLPETATEAEVNAALSKQATALAKAESIAKLSGAEKAYYDDATVSPDETAKAAFLALTTEKRAELMKAKPMPKKKPGADDDENSDDMMKVDGTTIRKSVVGPEVFAVMKSQQLAITKAADEAAVGKIEKRIEPLKFVLGKAEGTAALLHGIAKALGQESADKIEGILKSANDVMAKSEVITKEFGGNGSSGGFSKALDGINAKADELKKANPKLSIEKARDMARQQNPDLAKQEQEEAVEARKAARG